jgi:hypothetical protein
VKRFVARMKCDDVLVQVGQEARVNARLGLKEFFRLGLSFRGSAIRFFVDDEETGDARVGWDGAATATFTARQEREYRVLASCLNAQGREVASASATIFARVTERAAIILDVDGTLSHSSAFAATFRSNRKISPLENAAQVTRKLAKRYDLIYVTGRKRSLGGKTVRWLGENGFPRAPAYFSPLFARMFHHQRFKTRLIGELKRSWKNIAIGIGDRDADARAYAANGLRAILIRESGPSPLRATVAPDWNSIRELLLG